MTDVQPLLDQLANTLRRSIAIDDPEGRLIASSRHFGDEDGPRVNVVLTRDMDRRVHRYLHSFGIRTATGRIMIPENRELGLRARCCYPLRWQGKLGGFLWLIGPDVNDGDVRPYVERIAGILGQRPSPAGEHAERSRLAAQLLDPHQDIGEALRGLRDHGVGAERTATKIITVLLPEGIEAPPTASSPVLGAWNGPDRHVIVIDRADGAVVLLNMPDGVATDTTLLAVRLQEELAEYAPKVGVSETGLLAEARKLHRHSELAAHAGTVVGTCGPVTDWETFYPYNLILDAASDRHHASLVPDAVTPLLDPSHGVLRTTAETYLDCGGDRGMTSAALFIHRSTLYYRLNQIGKLTGLDLSTGHDRLIMHVALKVERLLDAVDQRIPQDEERRG
ncbi:MAG: PucR family transcriptional regulator [Corynebacterium sp.]|uniref:PucR family transcriptional regulator n=1 Tax=unclassified Corynebacterium TaxID=2624378 RepID=UPI003F937463